MRDIIIAYPNKNTAMKLRALLIREGYRVVNVCALGATALNIASEMNEGVIICASILTDMSAGNIAEHLSADFDVIALSKGGTESYMGNLINLPIPLNIDDFLQTVSVLVNTSSGFTRRSKSESDIIRDAKSILINTQGFNEGQAHQYLQKESMKQSKSMVEIAKNIIGSQLG